MPQRLVTFGVLLLTAILPSSVAAKPSVVRAEPGSIARALKAARPGTTIELAPGSYGTLTISRGSFMPALKINAKRARFTAVVFAGVSGVELQGGQIVGTGGRSYGISIRDSARIRIRGMRISGAHRGIVVNESTNIALLDNDLSGLISDGIDIALSRHVRVERNRCTNFKPTPATFSTDGQRIRDGDHPDCIQAWSRPTRPPTSDLTIVDNVADGAMQGIFLGNHVRNGVDDGGFDRVVIRGNQIRVSYPQGIGAYDVRDSQIVDNVVRTVPGARLAHNDRPVKANLSFRGQRVIACGNLVEANPKAPGTDPC